MNELEFRARQSFKTSRQRWLMYLYCKAYCLWGRGNETMALVTPDKTTIKTMEEWVRDYEARP